MSMKFSKKERVLLIFAAVAVSFFLLGCAFNLFSTASDRINSQLKLVKKEHLVSERLLSMEDSITSEFDDLSQKLPCQDLTISGMLTELELMTNASGLKVSVLRPGPIILNSLPKIHISGEGDWTSANTFIHSIEHPERFFDITYLKIYPKSMEQGETLQLEMTVERPVCSIFSNLTS